MDDVWAMVWEMVLDEEAREGRSVSLQQNAERLMRLPRAERRDLLAREAARCSTPVRTGRVRIHRAGCPYWTADGHVSFTTADGEVVQGATFVVPNSCTPVPPSISATEPSSAVSATHTASSPCTPCSDKREEDRTR